MIPISSICCSSSFNDACIAYGTGYSVCRTSDVRSIRCSARFESPGQSEKMSPYCDIGDCSSWTCSVDSASPNFRSVTDSWSRVDLRRLGRQPMDDLSLKHWHATDNPQTPPRGARGYILPVISLDCWHQHLPWPVDVTVLFPRFCCCTLIWLSRHWVGPGFSGDIDAIDIWLIDWLIDWLTDCLLGKYLSRRTSCVDLHVTSYPFPSSGACKHWDQLTRCHRMVPSNVAAACSCQSAEGLTPCNHVGSVVPLPSCHINTFSWLTTQLQLLLGQLQNVL